MTKKKNQRQVGLSIPESSHEYSRVFPQHFTFQFHADRKAFVEAASFARGAGGRGDVALLVAAALELPMKLLLQHSPEEALKKRKREPSGTGFLSAEDPPSARMHDADPLLPPLETLIHRDMYENFHENVITAKLHQETFSTGLISAHSRARSFQTPENDVRGGGEGIGAILKEQQEAFSRDIH